MSADDPVDQLGERWLGGEVGDRVYGLAALAVEHRIDGIEQDILDALGDLRRRYLRQVERDATK